MESWCYLLIGIYRLYNLVTCQSYIGQSKDLLKRFEAHINHRNAPTASPVDRDIGYYGLWNFVFQILELCNPEELDWKEDYWIKYFGSNINGYNILDGGQHNFGHSNPNRKITANDVYYIRDCYNNRYDPNFIYNTYYKGIISYGQFFNIWEGNTWPFVHMDVYTEENKKYYKDLINNCEKEVTNFSDEEIMRFRKRYVNETAEEIYNSENIGCKFNTFRMILSGDSYKHLPIYSKKKKCWINRKNM